MIQLVITEYEGGVAEALFEDHDLRELTFPDSGLKTGDFVTGRVENTIPSLSCAFIEIEKGVKAYYSFKDNKRHHYLNGKEQDRLPVQGDLMLVQIEREPMKTKPYTVTSDLSLTGRSLVLVTDSNKVHISKKIRKSDAILALKKELEELSNESGFGFIVRTNAESIGTKETLKEAERLIKEFSESLKYASHNTAFKKIYSAPSHFVKRLQSLPESEIEKVITDIPSVYAELQSNFGGTGMNLQFFEDDSISLTNLYSLSSGIDHALRRVVRLKSGASIVIDPTEALTAIDVNTGKSTDKKKHETMEEAVLRTNLEASKEILKQIRLRNISGMILVDFINMKRDSSVKKLLTVMSDCAKNDPIQTDVLDMTRLGLVEITRKKEGRNIYESKRRGILQRDVSENS